MTEINLDAPAFIGIFIQDLFVGTPEQFRDAFGFEVLDASVDARNYIRQMLRVPDDDEVRLHAFYTNYARNVWFNRVAPVQED